MTLSIFSCFLHIQPPEFSSPRQSRHPERSASQIYPKQRVLWRGVEEPVPNVAEGTPAMLVGGCSWELSGRKLHRKIRKSQTPEELACLRQGKDEMNAPKSMLILLSLFFVHWKRSGATAVHANPGYGAG
jgi:hypothetical protein